LKAGSNVETLLETIMIICFGISWPVSVYKSWTSATAKGKSFHFETFIWMGYIAGIAKNFVLFFEGKSGWSFYLGWFFYFFNFAMITIDIALYFRNVRLDRKREAEGCLLA